MDDLQKKGAGLTALGIAGLVSSYIFPFKLSPLTHTTLLKFTAMTFVSAFAIAVGVCGWIYGDKLEEMLGPLKSDERRKKVKTMMIIFAVPAILAAGLLYYLVYRTGLREPYAE